MSDIKKEELTELYDFLQNQLVEDRKVITELYSDLKSKVITVEDYAVHGLTLAKFGELLVKQTSQLVEVIRINQKEIQKDSISIDDDDRKKLYNEIGN